MKIKENKNYRISGLKKGVLDYILVITALICCFIVTRLLEFTYIRFVHTGDVSLDILIFRSINFDSLFVLDYSYVLLLPVMVISIFSPRISGIISRILAFLLMIIHLGLTQFFLISNNILTGVVFEFSFNDLMKIVSTEFTSHNLILWVGFIFVLALSFYLLFYVTYRIKPKRIIGIVLIAAYFILGIIAYNNMDYTLKSIKYFDDNYQFLVGNSKEVFFLKSIRFSKNDKDFDPARLKEATNRYHRYNNKYFRFCSSEYPFVHNEDYRNVLGKYFRSDSTLKPNVVILVCESLSSSFSGPKNCTYGSLTPFLDSLSAHSLYWENFFSNAERSYGALPDILASLPSGTVSRGFINMNNEYDGFKKYPSHTGIIKLLKENGYLTNYFYGGWGDFDNTGSFLKEDGIDNFISEGDFDKSKYHKAKGELVWGYNDKDLFALAFDQLNENHQDTGYLSVYQTLSLHSPFNLSEKDYYSTEYLEKKFKQLKLKPGDYKNIPDKVLSSIFFSDDALKDFFDRYKKRKDFSNTIFIITGDHSIELYLCNSLFERFRVPLIIYSPLLQQPAIFKGVCSHVDILPSILGLLENNYGLTFPEAKHWIGAGLDTSCRFHADRNFPLSPKSQFLPNYISGSDALFNGQVIKFDSMFNYKHEPDNKKAEKVKELFRDYLYLNNFVCLENKIWNRDIQKCAQTKDEKKEVLK